VRRTIDLVIFSLTDQLVALYLQFSRRKPTGACFLTCPTSHVRKRMMKSNGDLTIFFLQTKCKYSTYSLPVKNLRTCVFYYVTQGFLGFILETCHSYQKHVSVYEKPKCYSARYAESQPE
jgi:hypothetical protein